MQFTEIDHVTNILGEPHYLQSVPAARTYDVQCVDLVINSFELGLL